MRRVAALIVAFVSGCGGDDDFDSKPVDVAGVYAVSVTNKSNGCNFPNWEDGKSGSGIKITINQTGEDLTGSIDEWVGLYFQLVLGSNTFSGSVDGKNVSATIFGT